MTFRIPSKVVQYGYAEVEFDHQPGGSAEAMGKEYLAWVSKFQSAELGELDNEKKAPASKPKPKNETEAMLEKELGATKVGVANAEPWEKETPPATDKPWESNKPVAQIVETAGNVDDFDW